MCYRVSGRWGRGMALRGGASCSAQQRTPSRIAFPRAWDTLLIVGRSVSLANQALTARLKPSDVQKLEAKRRRR
jgi:hypothetical protein